MKWEYLQWVRDAYPSVDELNQVGIGGWELVSCMVEAAPEHKAPFITYIFKRKITGAPVEG